MVMKTGGNMPFMSTDGRKPRFPDIFFSQRENAMIIQKTLRGGFGQLKPGTVLCENTIDYSLVPYIPTNSAIFTGDAANGKSFLVVDYTSEATVCYVTIADSYRFAIGDGLVGVRDNSGTAVYCDYGLISAIDRTTDLSRAKITMTGVADATQTVANHAAVYVKSGTTSKFNKAKYVLDEFIDTGLGEGAVGALASVILGNAIVMKNMLIGYDAGAVTDLGTVDDGSYTYIK